MEKKFINPDTIHTPRGYTHVVALQGGRMLFVSGQVAIDKDGQIVGKGDLKVQAHKAAENLVAALKGAGASLADVIKMNTYVVNYKQDDYRAINDMRREFFPKENPPASTLIGVAALAVDGLLIEIEAVAALPYPAESSVGPALRRARVSQRRSRRPLRARAAAARTA